MNELLAQHLEDLKKSGLNDEIIKTHNIKSLQSDEIKRVLNWNNDKLSSGYGIPYPEVIDGIQSFIPNFIRVRLDIPLQIDKKSKLQGIYSKHCREVRYLAPVSSKVHLYIPFSVWKIIKNADMPILITEGEKKALKAAQEGFNCIGLPGVWGFFSEHKLISDFDLINWKDRTVFIVFDSDKVKNWNVKRAEITLSKELTQRGAKVKIVNIP